MLREVAHFLWHAPGNLRLKGTMSPAELYETVMGRAEQHGMEQLRAWLVRGMIGDVLEVGCGTGLMFPRYARGARVTAIEPDDAFREYATKRAQEVEAEITVEPHPAQSLPYGSASFDAGVVAMVLCSVDSIPDALSEIRRVLKRGATLRLIEHVVSERPVSRALMHAFNPLWKLANGLGCNMNRVVVPHLAAAGFDVLEVTKDQLHSPGLPAFPLELIEARAR